MSWIDAAHQLAFVEAEAHRVIGLPRPGLPRGFLPCEHDCEAVEIGDDAAIDRFIDGEQARLVREQLADGDLILALLRELGPVGRDPLFVVEPAA
jgi:hypothetical protein